MAWSWFLPRFTDRICILPWHRFVALGLLMLCTSLPSSLAIWTWRRGLQAPRVRRAFWSMVPGTVLGAIAAVLAIAMPERMPGLPPAVEGAVARAWTLIAACALSSLLTVGLSARRGLRRGR
jgi:hypothetical protein